MTSTFTFDSAEQGRDRFLGTEPGYIYSRLGNPTLTALEDKLAVMECGEQALVVGSGIGALTTLVYATVKAGDQIVCSTALYGCSWAFLKHGISGFNVDVVAVDFTDPEAVKAAIDPKRCKLVYFETPANPTNVVIDIKAISDIAHGVNKDIVVGVDNTFCSPYICNPLKHGADVVMHSATKYLGGHGDIIAGAIIGSTEFITHARLFSLKDMTGAVMCPMTAFLIMRGIKTLHLRVPRHSENAMALAEALEAHPNVEKVFYPFLKSHPQHDIATRQMSMGNGIVPFVVKGGMEAGMKFINACKLCTIAVSLGDAETLVTHPASSTHSPYNDEELAAAGIDKGLVRISTGLEAKADIIADVMQALDQL